MTGSKLIDFGSILLLISVVLLLRRPCVYLTDIRLLLSSMTFLITLLVPGKF